MPAEAPEGKTRAALQPFVLRWAEDAPEEMLWSRESVFSPPVRGLDGATLAQCDHLERTLPGDTQDTTSHS
jgi:hypothetical protein